VTKLPELYKAAVYSKLGQKLSFSFARNYRNHLCVAATAQNINTKMIGTMIGGTSHAVIRSLIAIAGLLELTRNSRELAIFTAPPKPLVHCFQYAAQYFRRLSHLSSADFGASNNV
jgi:ERCC4-related helicase